MQQSIASDRVTTSVEICWADVVGGGYIWGYGGDDGRGVKAANNRYGKGIAKLELKLEHHLSLVSSECSLCV